MEEKEWAKIETDIRTVQRTIAKSLLDIHGDKAYMLALIEMDESDGQKQKNWREILNLMEEMKGETK